MVNSGGKMLIIFLLINQSNFPASFITLANIYCVHIMSPGIIQGTGNKEINNNNNKKTWFLLLT